MKRTGLLIVLSIFALRSFSQGMYGCQAGVGYSVGYKGYITPTIEGYYLKRITQHIYAGGALSLQRYSFLRDMQQDANTVNYGDIISIRQKSSYLYICPKIDVGIGYRNYWHVYVAGGPGFFAGGQQIQNQHEPFWTSAAGPYGADTAGINTTYKMRDVLLRYSIGVSRRLPTLGYWNIMLTAEYTLLPGNLNKDVPALNTSYACFTIGIMHKYPQVWVEY